MKTLRKSSNTILSLVLAFAMTAAMLIAAPTKEVKAAYAAPTSTESYTTKKISNVSVSGIEDAQISYQQDNNGVNEKFIRILLPKSTTINTLQHLKFTITTKARVTMTWDTSAISFTKSGNNYTCDEANLYNKSYVLDFGGEKYILAAGIEDATITAPSNEPGVIKNAQLNGIATTMDRDIIQSDYMGNPYFGEMGYKWTSVTYILKATLPQLTDDQRKAVDFTYELNRVGGSEVLDLSSGLASTKINEVPYNVAVSFGDVIIVTKDNYCIDLSELLDYMSKTILPNANYVRNHAAAIDEAQTAYFAQGARTFAAGTTVMDIMQDFLNFAYDNNKFNEKSSRGADCAYIDYINGLSHREVNQYAGWMYSDDSQGVVDADGNIRYNCKIPGVMSNAYTMTKDTKITWFFTTDFRQHH